MFQLQIDDKELVAVGQKLSDVAASLPQMIGEELRWAGNQFVVLEKNIVATKRWTGDTERSIQILAATDNYVLIGPDLSIAPHAEHLIGGGTPHFAPFAKILDWVETKKGEGPEAAKKVWWKIAQSGTPAFPFPEMAFQQGEPILSELAMRIGTKVIGEITQ
jgi:hypothetical protein